MKQLVKFAFFINNFFRFIFQILIIIVGLGYYIFEVLLKGFLENEGIMKWVAETLKLPLQDVKDYGGAIGSKYRVGTNNRFSLIYWSMAKW